jgi:hypothetical protein
MCIEKVSIKLTFSVYRKSVAHCWPPVSSSAHSRDDVDRCLKREEFATELFELLGRDGGMLLEVIALAVRAVGLLRLVRHCGETVLCLLGWWKRKVFCLRVVVVVRESRIEHL